MPETFFFPLGNRRGWSSYWKFFNINRKEQGTRVLQETKKVKKKIAKIAQSLLAINLHKGDKWPLLRMIRANSFLKTALHLGTE